MDRELWAKRVREVADENPIEPITPLDIPPSVLDESYWGVGELYDPTEGQLYLVRALRALFPEVSSWSSSALHQAWHDFSQTVYLVSCQEFDQRDEWFLGFLYKISQGCRLNEFDGRDESEAGLARLKELCN